MKEEILKQLKDGTAHSPSVIIYHLDENYHPSLLELSPSFATHDILLLADVLATTNSNHSDDSREHLDAHARV
jgi:hypothetical protein